MAIASRTLLFGPYMIPVHLHEGMTVASESNETVIGGQENGNFGQFVSKGGFAIHVSLCSPDILGTFLHEFAHLMMFQRSHLLAFGDEVKMPNLSETICDLVSDAMSELYLRNADLLRDLASIAPRTTYEWEVDEPPNEPQGWCVYDGAEVCQKTPLSVVRQDTPPRRPHRST